MECLGAAIVPDGKPQETREGRRSYLPQDTVATGDGRGPVSKGVTWKKAVSIICFLLVSTSRLKSPRKSTPRRGVQTSAMIKGQLKRQPMKLEVEGEAAIRFNVAAVGGYKADAEIRQILFFPAGTLRKSTW